MRKGAAPGGPVTATHDPELVRQLRNAADDSTPLAAVFRLRPRDSSQLVPPAAETESITKQVLDRVAAKVGAKPERWNVFHNLGSFAVSAQPSFIRELMVQPEILSNLANRQPGDLLIRPVKPVSQVQKKPRQRKRR